MGDEFDKAKTNEVSAGKHEHARAPRHDKPSTKLNKRDEASQSSLVAGGELAKEIELLLREITSLVAANRSGDPGSSYLQSLRVRSALLKTAEAAQRGCPTPVQIERLVQLDGLATQSITAAFHPSAAALAEAAKPGERPTWRREASIWGGAPIAIKLPPVVPSTTPPGLQRDSPLVPKPGETKGTWVQEQYKKARERMKPPEAPIDPEIPERPGPRDEVPDPRDPHIVKTPEIPFDETAPLRKEPKSSDNGAKHVDPPPARAAVKPTEPKPPSSILDRLNFIPHVAIYNAYKAYQDMRKREAAEEAKHPKPPEPENPLWGLIKKLAAPRAPVPQPPPPARAEPAPAPAKEKEPAPAGPPLAPVDPSCAQTYPEGPARDMCEMGSQLRMENPEGGGSPRA